MAELGYYGSCPYVLKSTGTITPAVGDNYYLVTTDCWNKAVAGETLIFIELSSQYGQFSVHKVTSKGASPNLYISPTPTASWAASDYYYTTGDSAQEYGWARDLGEVTAVHQNIQPYAHDVYTSPECRASLTQGFDYEGSVGKIDIEGFYKIAGTVDYSLVDPYYISQYYMDSQQYSRYAGFVWWTNEHSEIGGYIGYPVAFDSFTYWCDVDHKSTQYTIFNYNMSCTMRSVDPC